MYCHLCKVQFTEQEAFMVHIVENHRQASELCEDDSDRESESSDDVDGDTDNFLNNRNFGIKSEIPAATSTVDYSETEDETMFVYDNLTDQLPLPTIRGGFHFTSRNISIWLLKFKELTRTSKFPLEPKFFRKVQLLHKAIFTNYCNAASSNEVTSAVLKVYEELDNLIHKNLTSIMYRCK